MGETVERMRLQSPVNDIEYEQKTIGEFAVSGQGLQCSLSSNLSLSAATSPLRSSCAANGLGPRSPH